MTSKTTVARPYAKAAFDFALQKKQIAQWSSLLQTSAQVVVDPRVAFLLADPRLTMENKVDLLLRIYGKKITESEKNFFEVLGHNRRLQLLPEIAQLFEQNRIEHEKEIVVQVSTAFVLTQAQQDKLKQALQIRLQRKIILQCELDKNLIGGVVIRAQDVVIDGFHPRANYADEAFIRILIKR